MQAEKKYKGMKKTTGILLMILLFTVQCMEGYAVQRFPKPDFESGYLQPETLQPSARAGILALADVAVLVLTLALVSWLVLKKRSRTGVFWTSVFSLAYFGFYRQGCICSIGSIQNVTLALFDHAYVIPLAALAFFILPLVFTLFFGRTFCAGVCPFGALQDLIAFKPQKPGVRLDAILGVIPYIYLGLAVLYAATGSDFIICRYDPFVGIFRFNASFGMMLFAGTLLASGIFLSRPYCRYLCPYGVLLNWVSRFSWKHITITPSKCIQCRLCEDSCPYDAIDMPVAGHDPEGRMVTTRRLIMISLLVPFFIALGGWTGSQLHESLASVNGKVRLARMLRDQADYNGKDEPFEITAYRSAGKTPERVYEEAAAVLKEFNTGGWILGGFIGLVFGVLLASHLVTRYRGDYTPNRGACFSCVRCVDYCPVDRNGSILAVPGGPMELKTDKSPGA